MTATADRSTRERGLPSVCMGLIAGTTALLCCVGPVVLALLGCRSPVGDRDLVVWHRPGQAAALDTDRISVGQEVGSVGVLRPVVDGRRLTFAVDGGQLVDDQTGSTWNILGEATTGELEGRRLPAVVHLDTFWFAWVGFRPDTRLVG